MSFLVYGWQHVLLSLKLHTKKGENYKYILLPNLYILLWGRVRETVRNRSVSHNSPHPNILLEPSCCIITYTSLSSLWKKWDQHARAPKIKNHGNAENRRTYYLSSWTLNLLVKIWDFPSRPLTDHSQKWWATI